LAWSAAMFWQSSAKTSSKASGPNTRPWRSAPAWSSPIQI
jgi:hypothetical protein